MLPKNILAHRALRAPALSPFHHVSHAVTKRWRWSLLSLVLALGVFLWLAPITTPLSSVSVAQSNQTNCTTVRTAAVTHGFETNYDLPSGDHFLISSNYTFGVTAPLSTASGLPGTVIFTPTVQSFGATAAGLALYGGTLPQGVTYFTPNGQFQMISCTDNLWDAGFYLASAGNAIGDTVRFFVRRPDGSGVISIATFRVESGGFRLTQVTQHGNIYRGSRTALLGLPLNVGDFIPFVAAAGEAGFRTEMLTFAAKMTPDSPFNDCLQLVVEINRSNTTGSTSVLMAEIVVNRREVAGDRARREPGLIGGLTSGYPTGLLCDVFCATCQPPPTPTPTPTPATPTPTPTPTPAPPVKCDTFCFRSAIYWMLNYDEYPRGVIFASGINYNQGFSTSNEQLLRILLAKCPNPAFAPLSPQEWFNREWITAQLNHLAYARSGSPNYHNVLWANLSCYDINFAPVTLSNGVVLTRNSMVKDLFMQATLAAQQNRFADFLPLGNLFNLLNGNSPLNVCN